MHLELIVVLLFAIATGVALVARWLKVPYTTALVAAGLIIGAGKWVPAPHLSKDLLFAVFLPGLLFEAAFHLDAKQFWANKLAICGLAVPGVVAAICVTALVLLPMVAGLHLERDFKFIDGLVFGGIVAATDPIAVVALFKSLGTPKRLGMLVEGESLLNDGTAIVLFGMILTVATGSEVTVAGIAIDFVRTCGLGVLMGTVLGYAGSKIIRLVDDPMIEITTTVVVAWGSFALAEELHASGVLATVSAGLICGNYGAHMGMSPTTKIAVVSFWAYLAFALNSLVFLLIGFEVDLSGVLTSWPTVLLAWCAMMIGRVLTVAFVTLVLRRSKERLPRWWGAIICWGGIRGGLSMVLVLGLPALFPHRQFLINVVFGVVVVSILVQGGTMAPLLKRLGIVTESAETARYHLVRGNGLAARAGLDELERLVRAQTFDAALVTALRSQYTQRIADSDSELRDLTLTNSEFQDEEERRLRRHLTVVEKERVLRAVHEGLSSDDAAAALLATLDARLIQLEGTEHS